VTIEPGTVVRVDAGVAIWVGEYSPGGLVAAGTPAKRITFTANSSAPPNGFWVGIRFEEQTLSTSRLEYCDVDYAGSDNYSPSTNGALILRGNGSSGPKVPISHCRVRHSGGIGIMCDYGGRFHPNSGSNEVTGCSGHPVRIDDSHASALPAGTYTGNGIDRILVEGGQGVATSGTWINPGVPYEIAENLHVGGAAAPVLRIEDHAVLEFRGEVEMTVGWTGPGTLIAERVVFLGRIQTKGYWVGIVFEADGSGSLKTCWVLHGGYDSSHTGWDGDLAREDDGNILVFDAPYAVTIDGCYIADSAGYGVVRGWQGLGNDYSLVNAIVGCDFGTQSPPR
jgi:hypothetical protein